MDGSGPVKPGKLVICANEASEKRFSRRHSHQDRALPSRRCPTCSRHCTATSAARERPQTRARSTTVQERHNTHTGARGCIQATGCRKRNNGEQDNNAPHRRHKCCAHCQVRQFHLAPSTSKYTLGFAILTLVSSTCARKSASSSANWRAITWKPVGSPVERQYPLGMDTAGLPSRFDKKTNSCAHANVCVKTGQWSFPHWLLPLCRT